jgi:hypothetical protein
LKSAAKLVPNAGYFKVFGSFFAFICCFVLCRHCRATANLSHSPLPLCPKMLFLSRIAVPNKFGMVFVIVMMCA